MGFIGKVITGVVVTIGTEIVSQKILPAAIKKSKKLLKELEEKASKKGE